MSDAYTKNLEDIIKQMLRPLKNVPLSLVIEALSGHKIIPFDNDDEKDKALLVKLTKVAKSAGATINKTGIKRPRPNEVGNDIEPFLKHALKDVGYKADTPATKSGTKKATGYPDIEFKDEHGRTNYIECKTFNIKSLDTTMRSFYLSPSEDFKITSDAHHFAISYEIINVGKDGNKNIYKCKRWKILTLEKLLVDVKYEFNSDNIRLYSNELILAQGNFQDR